MKGFFKEFREFISKGNVLDLAVAVIIGAAFQSIITSLTDDIISPVLGLFGGINLDQLVCHIGSVELRYGAFLSAVINFVIMALVIFILIKVLRGMGKTAKKLARVKEEEAAPTTKECPYCCSTIAIKALRCPECTTILDDKLKEAIEKSGITQ